MLLEKVKKNKQNFKLEKYSEVIETTDSVRLLEIKIHDKHKFWLAYFKPLQKKVSNQLNTLNRMKVYVE